MTLRPTRPPANANAIRPERWLLDAGDAAGSSSFRVEPNSQNC